MNKVFLFLFVLIFITACVAATTEVQPTVVPSIVPEITATADGAISPETPSLPAPTSGSLPVTPEAETSPGPTPGGVIATQVNVVVFPPPEQFEWVPLTTGLRKPVGITNAGDGTGRLFVVEQAGTIRILQNGVLNPEPFLDIIDRVGSQGSEQGLLGLAFHPQYATNGYFFVNYTDLQGDTVISRFQVDLETPNQVDISRETMLMKVAQPFANHNGGGLEFGPDGYLYLGFGDGGSAGDPQGNGQSLTSLLGKLLRVDVDGVSPYTIPQDNPFKNGGARSEIWAYGLRNPWRFSFDAHNGDLYIADVGQNQWEEINYLQADTAAGANFGWNLFEGSHPYEPRVTPSTPLTPPVFEYSHSEGCSVTGGLVYRGSKLPEFSGIYLYGDYCSGTVWGLMKDSQGSWQNALLYDGMGQISSFGQDEQHEIYLVVHSGIVFRLEQK